MPLASSSLLCRKKINSVKVNGIGFGSVASCLKCRKYCIIAQFCASFCSSDALLCSQNLL